jgi:tetratricopeptide (TPR) repeat protein
MEKAVLYFISYMKSPAEQYKYEQKLLNLDQTHSTYKPSSSVYWRAGLTANELERYDEAIRIFEEFLQKFPTDPLKNDVEGKLRKLELYERTHYKQ